METTQILRCLENERKTSRFLKIWGRIALGILGFNVYALLLTLSTHGNALWCLPVNIVSIGMSVATYRSHLKNVRHWEKRHAELIEELDRESGERFTMALMQKREV